MALIYDLNQMLQFFLYLTGIGAIIVLMHFAGIQVKKVAQKEKDILSVQDEIINLKENRNGEIEKNLLEAKLEKLKVERQFLLDRLSFWGLIKNNIPTKYLKLAKDNFQKYSMYKNNNSFKF